MAKFTGKGAEISVQTTGATPTWETFGQVAEIGAIDQTAEEVDVTTLDGGDYRDFIQGFKDPGECQVTVLFDPNMPDQDNSANGWIGLFTSGETRAWAIRYNSSNTAGEEFGTFSGFVRDFSWGALNPDDPQQIQPTIRLSGPITLVDTLPLTALPTRGRGKVIADEDKIAGLRAELNKLEESIRTRRGTPAAQSELVAA